MFAEQQGLTSEFLVSFSQSVQTWFHMSSFKVNMF